MALGSLGFRQIMASIHKSSRDYRRGAIMGLTMAEAFVLISFALLLLFAFWQLEAEEKNTAEIVEFRGLKLADQQEFLKSLNDGSLDAFITLKDKGIDFSTPSDFDRPKDKWRFIDKDEVTRLVDSASKLPEDVQRDLADMVEANDAVEILKKMALLEELIKEGQTLKDISWKIQNAENQELELVRALKTELGDTVSRIGGSIDDAGSIILPDRVLFAQGRAEVTPNLSEFLAEACQPWLSTLMSSGVDISDIQIEGHASSEWTLGATDTQAYLGNLDLSQRRSQAVLRSCLNFVTDSDLLVWTKKHLIAVGYSSARPILLDGTENKTASRRVVFSATPNKALLLKEIETKTSYDRAFFGGWADSDNDCKNTRQEILQELSAGKVQFSNDGCAIRTGNWMDSYTGEIFTNARDVEIDHLVPLKWAWERGGATWSPKQRIEFANDVENLFVVEKAINRQKSANGPLDWLPPNESFRCDYVSKFIQIASDYELKLPRVEDKRMVGLQKSLCN